MKISAQINAEIYNYGQHLFNAVREAVKTEGTAANSKQEHEINQKKLENMIQGVLEQATFRNNLTYEDLWQILWQRVVYAGTNNVKATAEISSMKAKIPIFQSLENYVDGEFVFDKKEWKKFSDYCKKHYRRKRGDNWLQRAKLDSSWAPEQFFQKTTEATWRILIKDQNLYPDLKFSALDHKIEKYFALPKVLLTRRINKKDQALNFYLGGIQFSEQHLIGDDWLKERESLKRVHEKFANEVGELTALHTMMDLGLKTIKPDIVMTYLFSRLGWLQTLPDSLSKQIVSDNYLKPDVINEMSIRSDVFANRLDRAGHAKAHRLLDIWFVKYGQIPEQSCGITINLQDSGKDIRTILENIKLHKQIDTLISANDANQMWPCGEFRSITLRAQTNVNQSYLEGNEAKARVRSQIVKTNIKGKSLKRNAQTLSEAEVEQMFVRQWKLGFSSQPNIYPKSLENRPKEKILKLIRQGIDPEKAFLIVLPPKN